MSLENENKEQVQVDIVEGGGSLILAYQVTQKKVLVVGGGEVALSRVKNLLIASAYIILICPQAQLHPELKMYIDSHQIFEYRDKLFSSSDLDDSEIVMVLSEILEEAPLIYSLSKGKNIPVNVADQLDKCDFWFMSQYREGPLQLAISSNGKAPRLAANLRKRLTKCLEPGIGQGWENFGRVRVAVRRYDPNPDSAPKRMGWLSKLADRWSLTELKGLDEKGIEKLIEKYYTIDMVPTFEQLVIQEQEENKVERISQKVQEIHLEGDTKVEKGTLYLVGAGPGDPDLLTIKAHKLLQTADLIVSDRLVSQSILDLIPSTDPTHRSERVKVAPIKVVGTSTNVQDQLNTWVLEGLQKGFQVVRLKVGDPALFGRLAEELEFFQPLGFPIVTVPGISSALAPPATLHFPLTQKNITDKIIIMSGTLAKGITPEFPPYNEKSCLVLLMAIQNLNEIVEKLREQAYPKDFPVTVVMDFSKEGEKVLQTTLKDLVQEVERKDIQPPAVIYLGWNKRF